MHRLRLYGVLLSLMVTILLVCEVLAFKIVTIAGYKFAASGLIFPLSFLFASVITEVYGYHLAGRIVWIQLICQTIFILILNIFIYLPTDNGSQIPILYRELYHDIWHVLIASNIAIPIAYFVNDILMSLLKIKMYGKWFFVRFILSNGVGKFILVSISYPINFHNIYTLSQIITIAFDTWLYKIIIAILLFPVAVVLANLVKRVEKLDFYDYGISYNPVLVFNTNVIGKNLYNEQNK